LYVSVYLFILKIQSEGEILLYTAQEHGWFCQGIMLQKITSWDWLQETVQVRRGTYQVWETS